ncbi:unnamed protein product, partial [Heterosigma akashiwo]
FLVFRNEGETDETTGATKPEEEIPILDKDLERLLTPKLVYVTASLLDGLILQA